MHQKMQNIETAARLAMVHPCEPARQETAILRAGFYVTAACISLTALFLIII